METFRLEGVTKKRPLPSFIKKLWFILTDTESQEHIFWADQGQVVCVPNAAAFSKVILPKHFKHNNWQSFVRQLNLYGFRKVYQLNLSYDDTADKRTVWQFKHDCFRKDHPEKLCDIKRRTAKHNQEQYALEHSSSSSQVEIDPLVISPNQIQSSNLNMYTDSSIHDQIVQLKERLEYVDSKRLELYEQTVLLSKIQADQQKAIRILMNYISQLTSQCPDSTNQNMMLQNTMNKLMNANAQPRTPPLPQTLTQLPQIPTLPQQQQQPLQYEHYEYDSDHQSNKSMSSNCSEQSNQSKQQQQTPFTARSLPSISSLIANDSPRMLPPLRKKPTNENH